MRKSIWKMFALASLIMFNACSEEEPQAPAVPDPDTEKPVITVLAPSDITKPLRATVTVRAEATDNTGIAKVEVFVNGASIASATSSPVEVSWDTKTVNDGTHQIKIVAEDTEGNTEEKVIQVEVKNVLFTFQIGPSYLDEFTEGWIFITDDEGTILDNQQMVNGETLTFETPEGYDLENTFTFNRLEYFFEKPEFGSSSKNISLSSYTELRSDSYILDNGTRQVLPSVGSHTILVANASPDYPIGSLASIEARWASFSGVVPFGTMPIKADLLSSPAHIIYWIRTGTGIPIKYEVLEAVPDEVLDLEVSDFTPFDSKTIVLEGATNNSFSLSYLINPGDYVNTVFFFSNSINADPEIMEVIYPDLETPEYLTFLRYSDGTVAHNYRLADKEPAGVFKTIIGSITSFESNGSKLQVSSAGDFLYLGISALFFQRDDDFNSEQISWLIQSKGNAAKTISIPLLPDEIIGRYPELVDHQFDFNEYSLHKASGVSSYEEWVKLRFSGQSTFSVSKEQLIRNELVPSPGGRSRTMSGENMVFDDWGGMKRKNK